MTVLSILGAVLIVMWVCSPALAVLIGRGIKLADSKTPPVGTVGETPPDRRAHLRAVP